MVVEAKTATETYRTLEEYNRSKQGIPIFIVILILYLVIEAVFVGVVLLQLSVGRHTFKSLFRKIKRR